MRGDFVTALEARIAGVAASWNAEEWSVATSVDAATLQRADYFSSFPDRAVAAGEAARGMFLNPAVCYHVYPRLQARTIAAPLAVTEPSEHILKPLALPRWAHCQGRRCGAATLGIDEHQASRSQRSGSGVAPAGIVISPGPCTPNEAGISLELVEKLAGRIPILGVCLGHQSIGQVFGGRVIRAPRLMHGKTSPIHHDGRGIFRDLANPFIATRYHSLIVERESVPDVLEISAWTEEGEIMGLRHRALAVDGVQFHPESILEGKHLLANFLAALPSHAKAA